MFLETVEHKVTKYTYLVITYELLIGLASHLSSSGKDFPSIFQHHLTSHSYIFPRGGITLCFCNAAYTLVTHRPLFGKLSSLFQVHRAVRAECVLQKYRAGILFKDSSAGEKLSNIVTWTLLFQLGYSAASKAISVFIYSLTASATEDSNSIKEETDVKPTVLPPPTEEDLVDVKVALDSVQSSLSPWSDATASTGEWLQSNGAWLGVFLEARLSVLQ